jgi:branched-chain amino acid transport system permease protein
MNTTATNASEAAAPQDWAMPGAPARVERLTASSRVAIGASGVALLVMLSMPWWADSGVMRAIIELSCYIVLAQMWNLLAGYAGLVSVGQQAFLGIGGYAMFILANKFGVNPFVASVLGLLAPAILAVPAYALLHRLEGPYFAIGTWVVAEVCRLLTTLSDAVGSGSGMTLRAMSQFSPEQRELGAMWLCAGMLVAALGGSYALLRSRYGLALTAMRDNPVSAASQGVDVKRLRFLVYVAAAVGSGMVGTVYYMSALRISPSAGYDPNWSSIAIFIVMVGGIGSIEGPIIGALIYFVADRLFSRYGAAYLVVLGLMTLCVALFARQGLWGLWSQRFDAPWFPLRRRLIEPDKPFAVVPSSTLDRSTP